MLSRCGVGKRNGWSVIWKEVGEPVKGDVHLEGLSLEEMGSALGDCPGFFSSRI